MSWLGILVVAMLLLAIRNGFAFAQVRKVMHVHLLRFALPLPALAGVFDDAHQLLSTTFG